MSAIGGTVIEIRDGRGRTTSAEKCQVTGMICIKMEGGEEAEFLVDPKDPDALAWLKKVFGTQLSFIL